VAPLHPLNFSDREMYEWLVSLLVLWFWFIERCWLHYCVQCLKLFEDGRKCIEGHGRWATERARSQDGRFHFRLLQNHSKLPRSQPSPGSSFSSFSSNQCISRTDFTYMLLHHSVSPISARLSGEPFTRFCSRVSWLLAKCFGRWNFLLRFSITLFCLVQRIIIIIIIRVLLDQL